MTNTDRTLAYPGEAVKALGGGKVAGYLVRFGSPADADRQGDYFTSATDFGLDVATKARIVYDHGLKRDEPGRLIGNRRIGTLGLVMMPDGLYGEGSLDLSVEPVKALYGRIERGELGWSSGSVERLVERQSVGGAREVKSWPLIEASLTPIPVDPRNRALAIKALIESPPDGAVPASLVESSERLVSEALELVPLWESAIKSRQAEGRNLSEVKRAALESLARSFVDLERAARPRPSENDRLAAKRALARSVFHHGGF